MTITNSLLWGDSTATEYSTLNNPTTSGGGSLSITFSDVQGGFAGTGNLDANPLYVNQAGGDLRLTRDSPAIHSGTTTGAPTVDPLRQLARLESGSGRVPVLHEENRTDNQSVTLTIDDLSVTERNDWRG